MLKTLAVVFCLTLACCAQPFETVVETDPSGARLSINNNYVGQSGEKLALDSGPLGATVHITATKDGYEPCAIKVELVDLKTGHVGPFPLQRAGLAGWLARVAPVVGAFLVGIGIFGLRYRKKGQELARREQMLAEVDRSDSLTAQTLGNYRLLNLLGKGGMASVYKAVPADTMDPKKAVALKVLRQEVLGDSEFMLRFKREAKVTNSLNHPHILRMIDWGSERKYFYLALELVEGGDLRKRMTGEPLPPAEAWTALQPVCQAVAYAHSQGVVHRDLKPENFLITEGGVLKVGDFGLARIEDQERLTATGTTLGTPAYMAPEQIQAAEPHPGMDQYAIGVIAYELITGRLPFEASDPVQMIFKTITEPPTPPSRFAHVSPQLEEVILRMLEKKPSARYPSVLEAGLALEAALAD